MSRLTEAEYAYKQQRANVRLVGIRDLRRVFFRAHKRAANGSDLAKVPLWAILDEYASRGVEPPSV